MKKIQEIYVDTLCSYVMAHRKKDLIVAFAKLLVSKKCPFLISRYDPQTDSIIFANNHPFSKENYKAAGLRSEALFRFCRRMIKMKVDNAEFGLLTAITIFSERKNLKQRKRVEKIQEIYVDALRSYVMSHRKKDPIVAFAKLLGALVELRSLGNLNSRTCFDLKLVNRRLPDFLAEIWDIK